MYTSLDDEKADTFKQNIQFRIPLKFIEYFEEMDILSIRDNLKRVEVSPDGKMDGEEDKAFVIPDKIVLMVFLVMTIFIMISFLHLRFLFLPKKYFIDRYLIHLIQKFDNRFLSCQIF